MANQIFISLPRVLHVSLALLRDNADASPARPFSKASTCDRKIRPIHFFTCGSISGNFRRCPSASRPNMASSRSSAAVREVVLRSDDWVCCLLSYPSSTGPPGRAICGKNYEAQLACAGESGVLRAGSSSSAVHPNIVRLSEVVYEKDNIILMMEYCEHSDLFDHLCAKAALPLCCLRSFIYQLLKAL
jgi:hypothetical protein